MRLLMQAIAASVLGPVFAAAISLLYVDPPQTLNEGNLRCEGAGSVIINVAGKDYAVNAKAGPKYPPIQTIWNKSTVPALNIDRLLIRGLTLCDWETPASHN
jgi:hypothetical protein